MYTCEVKPAPERFARPAEKSAADTPDTEERPEIGNDPLAELKAVNDEAVGWLTIDGTNIDYPIVQTADNSFYLQNGFDKKDNHGLGCPFLDSRCDGGFGGFNSIVYAHHIMGNQAMFADLTKYKSSAFMREYPRGKLLTAEGVHDVRFFAYMTIPSTASAYRTIFENSSDKDKYIDDIFGGANYTCELTADDLKNTDDLHLLLLSTCTFEYDEARGILAGVIEE